MRHLVPIAAIVPALGGCTWLGGWNGASDVQPPREPTRTVSVYAAVLRQLVTKDHTFGGADPGVKAVYILDGAVRGAGHPTWPPQRPRTSFSDGVETDLAEALADLPPVIFVQSRASVLDTW